MPPADTWLTAETALMNFAIVSFDVPVDRLRELIPQDRFEVAEFSVGGASRGLVSGVMFEDVGFHFCRFPLPRMTFAQTNYRAYIRDRRSGEHVVWFFGTTLGSASARIPRRLWKMPWHRGRYRIQCDYDEAEGRFRSYKMSCESALGVMDVELTDTGKPQALVEGFESLEEQALILSHPVEGYFMRRDGGIGRYSVWHDLIPLTVGSATKARFGLFESLGLVPPSASRMPHSVLLSRSTRFKIHLPPKRVN